MNRQFSRYATALMVLFVALPQPALAYIGPGVGAGAITATLGIIGSIFLMLFAILWYPVKRLIRAVKRTKPEPEANKAEQSSES